MKPWNTTKYMVVRDSSVYVLMDKVNELLEAGWQLAGGIGGDGNYGGFMQAMTKRVGE